MYNLFIKRLLDVVISAVCIIILLPVWIIIPIIIYLEDGGKPFFVRNGLAKT